MKKLYRKGTVHPSPPPSSTPTNFLSFSYLPAAILTLVAALSADDKEVLAYLLSCPSSTTTPFDFDLSKPHKKHNNKNNITNNVTINNSKSHVTCFTCYCFSCYTTYWARWDSSPNRQLIHEIIDALEDDLLTQRKKKQGANKKDKRRNTNNKNLDYGLNEMRNDIDDVIEKYKGSVRVDHESGRVGLVEDDGGLGQLGDEAEDKQGFVKKMVSFVWGSVWG